MGCFPRERYTLPVSAIPTSGVVCLHGDAVLLLEPGPASQHQEQVWGLPAGRVEPGETPRQAAVRELAEEAGIVLAPERLIELPQRYRAQLQRRDGHQLLMEWVVFAADQVTEPPYPTPEGLPHWVAFSALGGMNLQQNVAAAIAQARQALRG